MQGAVNKAERDRKEASKYAELAKHAQPAYLGQAPKYPGELESDLGILDDESRSPPLAG
jgi:hypothetical protein